MKSFDDPTDPLPRRHQKLWSEGRTLSLASLSLLSVLAAVPLSAQASVPAGSKAGSDRPAVILAGFQQRGEKNVSLVFTKADVRDVLTQIAGYTRSDILVTPGATGVISINLRNRAPEEAIRLVAAVAGMSVVRVGGAYIVGPAAEVQKAAAEFGQTETIPLRYAVPADAAAALSRMVPHVHAEATKIGLLISGLPKDLADAEAAIRQLDVEAAPAAPPKPETDVVTVHMADPAETERVLHEAFPNLKITRQERTLILLGVPADLDAAHRALQALDVEAPATPQPREVFVYRLKFLNARSAATALQGALGGGSQNAQAGDTGNAAGGDTGAAGGSFTAGGVTITLAPEAVAPPAANFNPLTSTGGFGGSSSGGSSSGGGGSGSSTSGGGAGGSSGGAAAQQLSRPTRLIIIGPKDKLDLARTLLEQTDVPQPLVRIEAVLVEVNTDYMKSLGLNWDVSGTSFTYTQPAGAGGRITGQANATVSLSALITQNKARILASPNISVVDNEDASIFIGDLRRFRGETVVTPNAGTVQGVDSLPVGIALLIRPRIHPDGQVTLKVHPVISSVTSVSTDGLPQTSSREADTTVRLKEGEELVIGGLDRTQVTRNLSKLPILGDIPVLGEFFRNRTHSISKTTVVVIIRAFPLFPDQAPARDFRKGIIK